MTRYTIDHFEGTYAVFQLDTRKRQLVPVRYLPENVKEGDILRADEFGTFFLYDPKEQIRLYTFHRDKQIAS